MRYGIPLLKDRVAPRCTFAESVLMVVLRRNRTRREDAVNLTGHSLLDLVEVLSRYRVDTLICGGISRHNKEFLLARNVDVIDNVAGSVNELLDAIRCGGIHPGYGLANAPDLMPPAPDSPQPAAPPATGHNLDCLRCEDRVCLRGQRCDAAPPAERYPAIDRETSRMLEAALDISSETDRTLCRLSELIYFCLEMRYQRIGVAYCVDLQEPAEILVQVLRRFFDVFPVSCKIGGRTVRDPLLAVEQHESGPPRRAVACNPRGQAAALNNLGTDLNVLVGACMGADCIFSAASEAPVTTLFVKDRSLANNPIGAVYSDYYLNEAARSLPRSKKT